MITFLIPTINRSDLIIKYLNYLKMNKFNGQVLLGDSSNMEHYQKTENYIQQLDCEFEVQQFYFPNMYPHLCIQEMLANIKFPYSMYIHDDDYLILDTLYKCVDFLDSNPEYSGVGGKGIACYINENNDNKIDEVYEYKVSEIMLDTAVKRLDELMNNYSVINFSLARTKDFLTRWPSNNDMQDRGIGGEYLPAAMLATQGKVKMVEDLFVVRQIHGRRSILPNYFDTFLLPAWGPSINFSLKYVAKHVAEIDSIPFNEAYEAVKNAWMTYYKKEFLSVYVYDKKKLDINNFAKSVPGLKPIYKLSKALLNKLVGRNPVSLSELLSVNSPYHNDFLKVYNVITNETLP